MHGFESMGYLVSESEVHSFEGIGVRNFLLPFTTTDTSITTRDLSVLAFRNQLHVSVIQYDNKRNC